MSNPALSLSEEASLNFTLEMRKQLVTHLTQKGVPDSTDDQYVLLNALDGMDKNVLNGAKLRLSAKSLEDSKNMTNIVGEYLSRLDVSRVLNNQSAEQRVLELDYELSDVVDGEMEINPVKENYEQFMERHYGSQKE